MPIEAKENLFITLVHDLSCRVCLTLRKYKESTSRIYPSPFSFWFLMPYITRDSRGVVIRAALQPMHGAEMVPYSHPDLVVFLEKNGLKMQDIDNALAELRKTDGDMARAVEDVIMALFKKNILKMSDLPTPVQNKVAQRVKLRLYIQEAFDKASGQTENTMPQTQVQVSGLYDTL